MDAIIPEKQFRHTSVQKWKQQMPNFVPRLSNDYFSGLEKSLEEDPEQCWFYLGKADIRDKKPLEHLRPYENYDIIFFASSTHEGQEALIDNEVFEIVMDSKVPSVKKKARQINLKGFKPINGRGEWTYIDVLEIKNHFQSFDFIALKKEVVLHLINQKDFFDIFESAARKHLAKTFRVGIYLNRIAKHIEPLKVKDKEMALLLKDTFEETPKIIIDEDCVVVTAADSNIFVGLQYLVCSIVLSHKVNFIVYDLGLKEEEINWLNSANVKIVKIHDDDLLIPRHMPNWQTWNKPVYISKSKKQNVLWIDADAIVLRSLRPAFEIIKKHGILVTADNIAKNYVNDVVDCLSNFDLLYELLPTPSKIIRNHPNAGIVGFNFENTENEIFETWYNCIVEASKNNEVFSSCKWYDQGALLWAIEKECLSDKIAVDPYWNDGQSWSDFGENFIANMSILLQHVQVVDSGIIHFAGMCKPWRNDDRFEESVK